MGYSMSISLPQVLTGLFGLSPDQWDAAGVVSQFVFGVGVTAFAWLEWRIHRNEVRENQRAALNAAFAEAARLQGLRHRLDRADLVAMARSGVLDPDVLQPRDWGLVVGWLAEVSATSAVIGAMAYSRLDVVVQNTQALNASSKENVDEKVLREKEAAIREGIIDVAESFTDALRHAPKWLLKISGVNTNQTLVTGRSAQAFAEGIAAAKV